VWQQNVFLQISGGVEVNLFESLLKTTAIPMAIALLVVAVVYAMVYAGSARRAKRYRPGRPFEFTPVWFLASPEKAAPALAIEGAQTPHGETGGASDRW
jgi:hypothetical protein